MTMPNPVLLILTVGTGTAGRDSFIAEGLRKTVELIDPRRYWLVPSDSPLSIDVADFIREHFPNNFAPWSDTEPYHRIGEPDLLLDCRSTVRRVIERARAELAKGERLIVNPTSGTKQMSAGATIAALDEGVGELVFTVGERADGVVKTGTERLETFDASGYFAEKNFAAACDLFRIGAFEPAASLLASGNRFPADASLCRCLHEWERLDYQAALERAKNTPHPLLEPLLPTLRRLVDESSKPWPSAHVVADLLRSARHLVVIRDFESAVSRACKGLEMGLRLDFNRRTKLHEPYPADRFLALPELKEPLRSRVAAKQHGRALFIGQRDLAEVLAVLGSQLGAGYIGNAGEGVRRAVEIRNILTHQLRSVTLDEAQQAISNISVLLQPLNLPAPVAFPRELSIPTSLQ